MRAVAKNNNSLGHLNIITQDLAISEQNVATLLIVLQAELLGMEMNCSHGN